VEKEIPHTNEPTIQTAGKNQEDIAFLIKEARMAREKGDTAVADAYMRSVAEVFKQPEVTSQPEIQVIESLSTPAASRKKKPMDSKMIKQGEVSFVPGAVPEFGSFCGLPTFYHKNVRAMHGSVPLTIFDPKWQQQAAAVSSTKKKEINRRR